MKNPFPQKSSKNEVQQNLPPKNNSSNETKTEKFISNMKIEYYQNQNQISELNPQDFIRTSSENIPNTDYIMRMTGIPFGINLTPFPDIDTSLISQYSFGGGNGIIPRCSKCKSFYNPYCEINNNYTSYKCNICHNLNELKNIDINTLKKIENKSEDVYDIFANSDYIENAPMSSNFIFILDTTIKSINSGALKIFIETIRYIIENHYFINEERTFVSFITFNNIGVSFYKINKKTNTMQIFEISGDEPFIPDNKKNLIFPVDDNSDSISNILDNLNNLFNINNTNNIFNKESEHLLFAIECGKLLLHNKGGKLIVLNTSNNWKNKIKLYEEIYYQNKNKKGEENNPFINLGKSLTKYQISCDIFQLQINGEVQDNQILINICNYSNGNFLFYKNFNENIHYKNLFNNIIKSVSNQKAYEIIIQYYITPILEIKQKLSVIPAQVNNSFLFPCININETFTFLLQYKEVQQNNNQKLKNNSNKVENSYIQGNQDINFIYIQFGIIYTSLEGIRIIRIINKKLNVCFDRMEYIKNIDIESVCCIMIKFLIFLLKKDSNALNAMAEFEYKYYRFALTIFKQNCLNELFSSFILCYLGIMKHKFFCLEPSKYKLNIEEIKSGRNSLLKMKIDDILNVIVPKIYDITNVLNNTDNFENVYYQPINLNKDSIYNDKVYLIDNGLFLTFYFSEGENNNKRLKIFFGDKMNFSNVGNIFHSEQSVFEDNENCDDFEVEKCKEIIDIIRNNKKNNYQDIFFSFAKSPSEALLKQCLILGNYCPWFQYSYKDVFNKL